MKKPTLIIFFILIKIIGLFIIAGILLTFLFPKSDFTKIELHGKLLDAAGKPIVQTPLIIYSGIFLDHYRNAQEAQTDQDGRFQVIFQKEYTITMLKSFFKIQQMAMPPFYFGVKLPSKLNSDKGNRNYYIVKVTKNSTTISAVGDSDRTLKKGEITEHLQIFTRITRQGPKWLIYAAIQEGFKS